MKKHTIVLISGGTGGHVIPAVNLGNYIVESGYNCYLFTDHRGKKYASNFNGKTIIINSSHLNKNFFGKLKSLYFLFFGLLQATFYLINIRWENTILHKLCRDLNSTFLLFTSKNGKLLNSEKEQRVKLKSFK